MDHARAKLILISPVTPYMNTDDGGEEFEAYVLSSLLDLYKRGEIDTNALQQAVNKFDDWKRGKRDARDAVERW